MEQKLKKRAGYRFTNDIVEQLGGMIVRGDAPAGGSLPIEAELATQFNASRTIVREAIKMLTAKGLVGSRPRRGTYVEPQSNWNLLDPDVLRWTLQQSYSLSLVRDFLILRLGIEPIAAQEAARLAGQEDLEAIKSCLESMGEAGKNSDEVLAADIAFHVAILHASGNRFLFQFSTMIETALRFSIRATNRSKGVTGPNIADHNAIYTAIAEGDEKGAYNASRALLDEAVELIDRLDTVTGQKTG